MGAIRPLSEKIAELRRMRVHPDFQRKGLGKKLLEILENKARELDYETIQLDTTIKQIAAQNFYKKNEYTEFKREIRRYFKGFHVEVIFYQKKL